MHYVYPSCVIHYSWQFGRTPEDTTIFSGAFFNLRGSPSQTSFVFNYQFKSSQMFLTESKSHTCSSASSIHSHKNIFFFLHFWDNTKVLKISQRWKFQRAVGVARRRVEDSTMCSTLLSSPKTTAVFGKVCLNRGDEEVDSGRPYTNTHRVCNRG